MCKYLLHLEQNNDTESFQVWKQTATMAEPEPPQGWRRTTEVICALRINPEL